MMDLRGRHAGTLPPVGGCTTRARGASDGPTLPVGRPDKHAVGFLTRTCRAATTATPRFQRVI